MNSGFKLEIESPEKYERPFVLTIWKDSSQFWSDVRTPKGDYAPIERFTKLSEVLQHWAFELPKILGTKLFDPVMGDVRRYLLTWLD